MMMRTVVLNLIVSIAWLSAAGVRADEPKPADAPAPVSFVKDVAPILVQKCQACHGAADPKGEYRVVTFDAVMQAGASSGASVEPGKPDDSELVRLIASEDADERMPKEADPLPAEQIALVKRWIAEGAKFDGPDPKAPLATIIPRQPHPDPPAEYRRAVPIAAIAFRPDGQELAVGGYREITIWNPATGALVRRIKDAPQRVLGLAYSPDGALLALAGGTPGEAGEVSLYDSAQGAFARRLGAMSDVAFGVAFSPDGKKLAGCGADRSIRVWDVATGAQERLIEDHADWVVAIAFSPDGKKLASASRDKTSKVFDATTGESVITYPGHGEQVFGVTFNADGAQVLTTGRDKKVHIWNPADAKKVGELGGFGGEVYDIVIDGGQVFACAADRVARQFVAADQKHVRNYEGHADWIYALASNDATKRLATGGYDGEVRVWNTADGQLVASFRAAPGLPAAQQQAAK